MSTATLHPEAQQHRHEATEPAVIAGAGIDAIAMPPTFGARVQAELEIMMLAGPVVAGPAQEPWIFLTQIANSRSPGVPADLLQQGVRLVPGGSRIPLPDGSGRRSWVTPPVSTREPAIWSAVIGAARRVAARPVSPFRRIP